MIERAKKDYYQNNISNAASKQSALFKCADELLNKKRANVLPSHESLDELCDRFALFFQEKIRKIHGGLEKLQNPDQVRGHPFKLFKQRATKDIRRYCFSHRVTDPWNSLPEKVVMAPSVKSFERRLDRVWRDQDLVYDFNASQNIRHRNNAPASPEVEGIDD